MRSPGTPLFARRDVDLFDCPVASPCYQHRPVTRYREAPDLMRNVLGVRCRRRPLSETADLGEGAHIPQPEGRIEASRDDLIVAHESGAHDVVGMPGQSSGTIEFGES